VFAAIERRARQAELDGNGKRRAGGA
jgi:hypothetical protein